MLAFNNRDMVIEAIHLFATQNPGKTLRVYILYYPTLSESDIQEIKCTCNDYDFPWELKNNEGLIGNYNYVLKKCQHSYDYMFCVDPDERPTELGWAQAWEDVMDAHQKYFYVSLWNLNECPQALKYRASGTFERGGHDVREFRTLVSWALGGFRIKAVLEVGGFSAHRYYGYFEHRMAELCLPQGYTYGMMEEYAVRHLESDPFYTKWKVEQAARRTDKTFEEWFRGN